MSDQMWRLAQFRFDEQIDDDEVYVEGASGELLPMTRQLAIDAAHRQGLNLVARWPATIDGAMPSCVMAKVTLPLRWESLVVDRPEETIDEQLWFDAACGGRDFLLDGGGHTFRGRMSAWCPDKQRTYRVSLDEMGDMSSESRYFVRGFLSGNEPSWPQDHDGAVDDADLAAWHSARHRFRATGSWYGRWGTCAVCGCVLLPDSASNRCAEHT